MSKRKKCRKNNQQVTYGSISHRHKNNRKFDGVYSLQATRIQINQHGMIPQPKGLQIVQ
jgi:hypothetical protein